MGVLLCTRLHDLYPVRHGRHLLGLDRARIVNGSIFGIFLLRAFFAGLPEEIFEAARIDGAGSFALIWHITIPMSTGILATLAVLDFIGAWNDFLWSFVAISSKSKRVISVGLYLLQADRMPMAGET